jgi:hypothetical protein
LELLALKPWDSGERIRVVWIHIADGSRSDYARKITTLESSHSVVAVAVRDQLFLSANSVLSDLNRLLDQSKHLFDQVPHSSEGKVTVAVLSKDSFGLPQIASPMLVPGWFPVMAGQEIFLRISDLLHDVDVQLLNCPESRVDQISELAFELERAMVNLLDAAIGTKLKEVEAILTILHEAKEKQPSASEWVRSCRGHLDTVLDARGYRISAKLGPSLAGRLVRLAVRSSPDQLGAAAKTIAAAFSPLGGSPLKPSLFGVLLRPVNHLDATQRSWHSVLVAIYQAYQLTTAAAHAGDYSAYPVGLIEAGSRDLARVLREAVYLLRGASA